jgi:hypothetical protein
MLLKKMASIVKGVYKHTVTNNLYNIIGLGRSVESPSQLLVVYEQLYEGKKKGTNEVLPVGSIWTRKYEDFIGLNEHGEKRFVKIDDFTI